jgi:hypothetical protein
MRELSNNFLADLNNAKGVLHPILKRIQNDHTLMLAIRDGYVNVYYRGGNILNIKEQQQGTYLASFDVKYDKSGKFIPILPKAIRSQVESEAWVGNFARLKEIMDIFFAGHNKPEREFQQLVARENNYSTVSNESEYFISDIEFADPDLSARFDLLAIRWLASQRTRGSNCKPALMEMKYGDNALEGSAGLLKHLKDIDALISDQTKYKSLLKTMASQFNQLDELGLINFKHSHKGVKVDLSAENKPEVIFILANHNPRSTKLRSILNDAKVAAYEESPYFDLRFFVPSFAGYGLHFNCMLTLTEFRKLLKS